jgi:Protein of unknown function (DUF3300)
LRRSKAARPRVKLRRFALISIKQRWCAGLMLPDVRPMEVVMSRCGKILLALSLFVTVPVVAFAQATNNPPVQGSQSQPSPQAAPGEQLLKPEQLEALVAPIALYPDELLANVLAA